MMIVAVRLRDQVHSRVRLFCFKTKVYDFQEDVKKRHEERASAKQLMFLTSGQSITEPSCSRSESSSSTPCLVGQDDDSSGQAESSSTLTCSSIVFQEKGV